MSFLLASPALREAYDQSPEELKRKFWRTWYRKEPTWVAFVLKSLDLLRGFRVEAVLERKIPLHRTKLDAALSGPCPFRPGLLADASLVFFAKEKGMWIDEVDRLLVGASAVDIETRVAKAMHTLEQTVGGDPAWKLFRARAELSPEGWLSKSRVSSAAAPVPDPQGEATAESEDDKTIVDGQAEATPPSEDDEATVTRAADELAKLIDTARLARPFSMTRALELLDELSDRGETLRAELELFSQESGQPFPTWHSLGELRDLKRQRREQSQATQGNERRTRLTGIAQAVGEIAALKISSRVKREKLLQTCAAARVEIETAATAKAVPELPLSGDGREWLANLYALRDTELDAALDSLRTSELSSLATFVEDTTWDQLEFASIPDHSTPMSGPVSIAAKAEVPFFEIEVLRPPATVELNKAVGPAVEPPAPVETRPLSVSVIPVVPASIQAQPAVPAQLLHGSAPEKKPLSECPEPPAIESSVIPVVNGMISANDKSHLVVARFLVTDRPILAAYYVQTLTSPSSLPSGPVFRLLALQSSLRQPDGLVAMEMGSAIGELAGTVFDDLVTTHLVSWAAFIIPTLVAPAVGASPYLRLTEIPEDLPSLKALSDATIKLADQVPQCSPGLLRGLQPRAIWERRMREISSAAAQFLRDAPLQTILFQAAGEVWRHQVRQGAIAELARLLQAPPTSAGVGKVEELKALLRPGKAFNRLIQEIHRKQAPGSREHIEARAVPQIQGKLSPLLELATRWLQSAAQPPPASDFVGDRIAEFRRAATPALESGFVELAQWRMKKGDPLMQATAHSAHQALQYIRLLLDTNAAWPEVETNPAHRFLETALCVPGLRIAEDGKPVGAPERQRAMLDASSVHTISARDALDARLAGRDLAGAAALVDVLGTLGDPTADDLRSELSRREDPLRHEAAKAVADVQNLLGTSRALGFFSEAEGLTLENKLAHAQQFAERGLQIDQAHEVLGELRSTIEARRGERLANAREQIATQRMAVETRERLQFLADKGDLATINEYLGRLREGQELPALDYGESLFGGFSPERARAIGAGLDAGGDLPSLATALRRSQKFIQEDLSAWSREQRDQVDEWLAAWVSLKQNTGLQDGTVSILLRGLGFVVQTTTTTQYAGAYRTDVTTEVLAERGLCPVPRYGSLARGRMLVHHVWNRPDERALLQIVGETAQESRVLIVFYYGRLSPERRLALATLSREQHRSFLVLDELLFVHLCLERENRLATFFAASIPYTFVDPFVTGSSMVPPEMFFGRRMEIAALSDSSNGRCFVYGGRQLGKTALLREAQRRFHDPAKERYSVWIDLLNHGIGREYAPEALWGVVGAEFGHWQSFQHTRAEAPRASPDPALIKRWLDAAPGRRILLLLDEADKFLLEDAKTDYAVARQLKGLMENTDRRFKVVFAGLHNVQRITQQANHPLAHLGDPITVGSFSLSSEWSDAFALAADPLRALGFRFSSSDLVARVLSLCNFYPASVQQFCHRLWRRFQERRLPGPPFEIVDRDIDEVYRDPHLRENIVGRFILTLQLDPAYWLLAYTFAHYFLENPAAAEQGLTPAELRTRGTYWHKGPVEGLSDDEFRSLVDEMCELGVFRHVGERYAFRNPNLLLLLGSREQIESKVLSGPREPVEFTPRNFRARWRLSGNANLRRPLTLSDEAHLADPHNEVVVLTGSEALELGTFSATLNDALPHAHPHVIRQTLRDVEAFARQLETLREQTRHTGDGVHIVRVPPNLLWDVNWLKSAISFSERLISKKRFIRFVFEADPIRLWQSGGTWPLAEPLASQLRVVRLKKWPDEFLRPWLAELSLPTANDAPQLLRATIGGWPALMHTFSKLHSHDADWRRVVAELDKELINPASRANWEKYFVGVGRAAVNGLDALRQVRALQPNADDIFLTHELADVAELIGLPADELQQAMRVAVILGLADEVDGGTIWDPVVERVLLRPQ